MDEKKEIGRKIWDLFLKNYSYSKIAKELGVSKSVVSNVINYTLPSATWCNENLQNLKDELIEKNKKIKKLKEEKEESDEWINDFFKVILITLSIYIIVTAIILYFVKINFYKNLFLVIGFIIYSIAIIVATFFITAYLK